MQMDTKVECWTSLDGELKAGAMFGVEDGVKAHRFDLFAQRDACLPRILWCMLNPSTADVGGGQGLVMDRTVARVDGFSTRWGYGEWCVWNMVSYRSPHPKAMRDWLLQAPEDHPAFAANTAALKQALDRAHRIMVAWGDVTNMIGSTPYRTATDALRPYVAQGRVFALGRTAEGYPVHPMARGKSWVKEATPPILWTGFNGKGE